MPKKPTKRPFHTIQPNTSSQFFNEFNAQDKLNDSIQSIRQINEIISKMKLEWNDLFSPSFNAVDNAVGLLPECQKTDVSLFQEFQDDLLRTGNYLVESNHQTLQEGLLLFQHILDSASVVYSKLSTVGKSLVEAKSICSVDYSKITENVKILEEKNEIAQILSSIESIELLLSKVEKQLTNGSIAYCWETLSLLKKQFFIAENQRAISNLHHFTEMKLKYSKLHNEFNRLLLSFLQNSCLSTESQKSHNVKEVLGILRGNSNEFENVYKEVFNYFRKSLHSALIDKVSAFQKSLPVEVSFLPKKTSEMQEIVHIFDSFENKILSLLFSQISDWFLVIFDFFNEMLQIGLFADEQMPYSMGEVFSILANELTILADYFTKKSSSISANYYLEDNSDDFEFTVDLTSFTMPESFFIRNVEFSSSSFYHSMAAKEEKEFTARPGNFKVSLGMLCSKIAPRNPYYTKVYLELFLFIGKLKDFCAPKIENTSQSDAGKKNQLNSITNEINSYLRTVESHYCASFLTNLQSRVTRCLSSSFGHSSSFDSITVGKETVQIFRCVPELIFLMSTLERVCLQYDQFFVNSKGTLLTLKEFDSIQIFVGIGKLSPFKIFEETLLKITSKFESFFNFLFGERTKASNRCASNLLANKILKSNDFFLSLTEKAINDAVVKKEFYSIYDFKKGRSLRKEEILDISKLEKILLLYKSILNFEDNLSDTLKHLNSIQLNEKIKSPDNLDSFFTFLLLRIVYTLRIEVQIQFIYHLEVTVFDQNTNYTSFLGQLLSFLAHLDSHCIRYIGPKCSQFIFKGIDVFLNEFFLAARKQIPQKDENVIDALQKAISHGIINICCSFSG